jgi:diacylglycerol kinase (ATP)
VRVLVVGRWRKGRRIAQTVAEVHEQLRSAGWDVESAVVKRKRDVRRIARGAVKDGRKMVVAVGGDGAVLQVATVLAGTPVALGIVPAGTGNLLAGNLGIPTDRDAAARTVLSGRRRRIDLGRATVDGKKHDFTVACGVGYDADIMDATSAGQKLRWGKLAYLANAVGQVDGLHNVPHEITIDGVRATTDAAQVFVANFGKMLPVAQPRRRVRGDDGLLDVIVVRASGPVPALLAGWEALTQKDLGESPDGRVFRTQARKVRIESTPRRLVETDGSVIGRTPITVSVRPRALTVMVPQR